ncbi:Murein DD-endopeptidase MepM and murein hydrolase activator NlpD, contain LysM domain [Duganella sp. CF402]|uniref:M23/M56 family metallopeptidase n=1 Tax=unclassified Duganella TaxID=2636909 RepID=UPI0008D7BE78|nr:MULTISPECIES: M23/M56 family metallopeptidase [unclassified Duganella]RZT11093.1 murein DD-endopeptidase MepM/ murein hydrolase activator NlpD [Duganella sp. BK701]SEK81823.1 Murein DD-endopeptidase MepM and murein hydrolase activator NlpD, contain LysM domain [Duganella sp. CF402]
MMAAELFAAQWLLACAGCVAVGLLVWLMLDGAARWLPALRTRRGIWLAAQCVVALAITLPFLPRSAEINVTPQITLAAAPTAPPPAARPSATGNTAATTGIATTEEATDAATMLNTAQVLPSLAALWLVIYAAGLAWAVRKQLRARRLWRGLLAGADRLSPQELQDHGAFTIAQLREIAQRGLTVLRTSAAISPMLVGVRRPRLLLPAHFDTLSVEQQQMIVAHELHHWRARDPLCLAIAAALQTLFWFNPALRWMARQMEWALELQCDQHVLTGRPQQERKQYAAALLRQWSAIAPTGAAAFHGTAISTRIRHMQQDGLPALGATTAWLIAAALASVLALGAMLQPALAYSVAASGQLERPAAMPEAATSAAMAAAATATPLVTAAPASTATPAAQAAAASTPEAWRAPVDNIRVTSFFGVMRSVLPTPHKGIDFAAKTGTPVHAAASGTIIAAGPIAENNGRYGTTVIIDHGGRQSLYAHLSSVNVAPGQHVQAGQHIGASGATGFATGPHLHLEVRENGRLIDPAAMFTNLDAYATPRALRIRRLQKG